MKLLPLPLLLLLLLLSTSPTHAQNIWYVDRDATGANTGRSWEDAWTHLDSSVWMGNQGINWAIIGDGDTIYISGGTDSTCYYPIFENFYNGIRRESSEGEIIPTFNETVIITKAWHEGHNGDVYFIPRNDDTYAIFLLSGVNNVKLLNLKFWETRTVNTPQDNGMLLFYGTDNIIESCEFYSKGLTTGVYLFGQRLIFRNNFYDSEANSLDNGIDPIGTGGYGNHIIEGNIIITRNSSPTTTSHRDILQFGGLEGIPDKTEIIIRNNLLMVLGNSVSWNAFVYSSGQFADTTIWYIYNNVMVSTTTASPISMIFAYQYNDTITNYKDRYFIFNNTTISNDDGSGLSMPINIGGDVITDSVMMHNNLVVTDAPVGAMFSVPAFYYNEYWREIDYNGWFEYGGLSGVFMPGNAFGAWTFEQWQADTATGGGGDINSITGNSDTVTFANKYGETFESYYTETGRGLGLNLADTYPFLAARLPDIIYDALGNPRGDTWDIGALQFQGGAQSNQINLNGKIFLQGPFNSGSLFTHLSQNSFLPASQPYSIAPWNYNGNESLNLSAGHIGSVVDWLLVELRSSSNPAQVVSRRAALLRNDGLLVDTDGSIGVKFNNVQEGNYYIAVFHRNHLSVMSANPVSLTHDSQLYDFTTGQNQSFGSNPMKDLGNGVFGMYAGDGDSNGGITIGDRVEVWQIQNGNMGYLNGDFNLDGGVNILDANMFWSPNNGIMSQVP